MSQSQTSSHTDSPSPQTVLKEARDKNLRLQLLLDAQNQKLIAAENEVQVYKKKHAQALNSHKSSEEEKEMTKLNLMSLKFAYKSLQEASTKNSSAYSHRISQVESELTEQKSMVKDVTRKLKASEESLQEEKALREQYYDNFVNSVAGAPSGISNQWQEEYITFQKAPVNIFKDYFRLRKEHDTLKLQSKISNDLVNSLRWQQTNSANKIQRLESEHLSFQKKESELELQISKLNAKVEKVQVVRDKKQKELDEHKEEAEELKKGMNDLKFQTKAILNHMEQRGEPIPEAQKQLYDLLMNDRINPALPSNLLIADNIYQIQDLNVKLQFELRKAHKKVTSLEKQVESLNADAQESKFQADGSLQSCNQIIDELRKELAILKAQEHRNASFNDDLLGIQLDLAEIKAGATNYELEKQFIQSSAKKWLDQSMAYQDELKEFKAHTQVLLSKISQLENKAREAEAVKSKEKDNVIRLEIECNDLKKKLDLSQEAREILKKQLDDETMKNSRFIGKIDKLSAAFTEDKKECKNEIIAKVQELHKNIDSKNGIIAQKDSEIAQLRAASFEARVALDKARSEAKDLRSQLVEVGDCLVETKAAKIVSENELSALNTQHQAMPAVIVPNFADPQQFALKVKRLEAATSLYREEIGQLKHTVNGLKEEKDVVNGERELLLAAKTKLEEEKIELIRKCNERTQALIEAKKNVEQQEKDSTLDKSAGDSVASDNVRALLEAKKKVKQQQEKNTLKKSAGDSLASDEIRALKAEKEKLDAKVAKLNKTVEEKDKENQVLERKYVGVIKRARTIQESNQQLKEEKVAKAKKISELEKELEDAPAKAVELEKEVAALKRQIDWKNVDVARANAHTSMANRKNRKLQLEIDTLKSVSSGQTKEVNPLPGDKRSRGAEDAEGGSPTKKQAF